MAEEVGVACRHCGRPNVELTVDPSAEVLTIEQFSRMYGPSRTAVFAMLSTGELPSFKQGKRRLITRAAARQWLAEKQGA